MSSSTQPQGPLQGDPTAPSGLGALAQRSFVAGAYGQPIFPRPSTPPTANDIAYAPWKYAGYPQFTRWVASDQAWFITRRFGTINARIILSLQDNIVQLEEQLNKLDHAYSQSASVMHDENQSHNGSFRLDSYPDRKKIMGELLLALTQYNSFVNEYSQLASRPDARKDDVNAVRTWLDNNAYAIHDPEAAYIQNSKYGDDLIAVNPKSRSWLRKVLEKTKVLKQQPLRRYLSREPHDPLIRMKEGRDTVWHNDGRVESFSATVIGLIALGMLIGPIWALYEVGDNRARLGIISGFIVAFYVVVGIATTAKVFESLAAVAAYSAVLMVFMQIQQPGSTGSGQTGSAGG